MDYRKMLDSITEPYDPFGQSPLERRVVIALRSFGLFVLVAAIPVMLVLLILALLR